MGKQYKIVVFYYTQTQQLFNILNSLLNSLTNQGCDVVYKKIEPLEPFPFPWTGEDFYQAFPESRQEIPLKNKEIDFSDVKDADLVILGYQPWFLSLSIPISTFLQEDSTQQYLEGKNIVTVVGSRNMWISSHDKVRKHFTKIKCKWVGNIVLEDKNNNLVSVLTILRWLIKGQKEATRFLPQAGVSQSDINSMTLITPEILLALQTADYTTLQSKIVEKDGVPFHNNLYLIERAGHKMFGLWSKWILKKGPYKSPNRRFRLSLFNYYLMTIIFVISPFGSIFFDITHPLRMRSLKRIKKKYLYLQD